MDDDVEDQAVMFYSSRHGVDWFLGNLMKMSSKW